MEHHHRISQIMNLIRGVVWVLGLALLPDAFNQVRSVQTAEAAGKGGYIRGTITLDTHNPQVGQSVTFSVSTNAREKDLGSLWVANRCRQNGVPVYQEYHGVQSGTSGPFTLNWPGGGAANCTAYVWFFPDTETPLTGLTSEYSVSTQ